MRGTQDRELWGQLSRSQETATGGWSQNRHWLALFLAVLGVRSVVSVIWPFASTSPRGLDLVIGIVLLALAVFVELVQPARKTPLLMVSMVVPAVSLAILTATRTTVEGTALLSSAWTLLTVMAGLYLARNAFLIFLVLQSLTYAAAVWVNHLPGLLPIALVTWLTAVIVGFIVFALVQRQRSLTSRLRYVSVRDPLTGVLNRRGAQMEAEAVKSVADRSGATTVVALIDLDQFKALNDRLGHDAGDEALVEVTRQWRKRLRTGDVLGRIGGDEFMLVLPDADEQTAPPLLRRLREDNPVSWTYGLATWHPDGSLQQALRGADKNLYLAKSARKSM